MVSRSAPESDLVCLLPALHEAQERERQLTKGNLTKIAAAFQIPLAEPPDQEYPLILTTGRRRSTYHTGTQTRRVLGFDTLVPQEYLEISPEDAAELKLPEGKEVMVISRRGQVGAPVKITDRSPPGVVFLSFHFPGQTLTNLVTTDAYDPVTETPEFKACAVRVENLPQG